MAIETKLCDCGCGRSRPMQSGGKYFDPKCRALDNRRKKKQLNNETKSHEQR